MAPRRKAVLAVIQECIFQNMKNVNMQLKITNSTVKAKKNV